MHILNEKLSSLLTRYYFGINHPSKIRLWNLAFRFMGHPRLKVPYGNRGWISIDYRDYLQLVIWKQGMFEPEVWDALKQFGTGNEILWDIGANVGAVSIWAAMDSMVKEVRAFEPNPKTFNILKTNLAMNDLPIISHNHALGDKSETKMLYVSPTNNSALASFILNNNLNSKLPVQVETVDHLVFEQKLPPPTLMKLDVEDYEKYVLIGAQRLLTEHPPKALVFEAKCDVQGKMEDPSLAHFLEGFGYKVSHIRRPENVVMERENYLAIKI